MKIMSFHLKYIFLLDFYLSFTSKDIMSKGAQSGEYTAKSLFFFFVR